MSNNIYDILGKLNTLIGNPIKENEAAQTEPVYENVEARGDIMDAIKSLEEKYSSFKKQLDERHFSDKKTFDQLAEPGDTYKTADGGTVTKTEKGIKHSAPSGKYGAGPEDEKDELDEKAVNPYAVGMAQAMKSTGDEPPLAKSTIKKAHKIAKAVAKQDESVELNEGDDYFVHATELTNYETVVNADSEEEAEEKAVAQIEADREEYQAGGDGVIAQYADKMLESKADIRNHPIYTNEEAWEHYSKELAEQEVEETVNIEDELNEISRLAGLAEKVGGNQAEDFVDDITKDKEECDEGFDPKNFNGETEYMFVGDDGEEGHGGITYVANVVDGRPVVDPNSLEAWCHGDGRNKLTDEWCSEMVAPGGIEHAEALKAAQEDADAEWSARDVDVPMDEGNEFTKARLDAIAAGRDSFEVDGKTYKVSGDTSDEKKMAESAQVNEDINMNITANGEEDVVNLVRKLAGMQPVAMTAPQEASCGMEEEIEEERDIEYLNSPREQTAPTIAAIPSGTDLHKSKVQDPGTANKAANPLAEKELEESLWAEYETMLGDIKG